MTGRSEGKQSEGAEDPFSLTSLPVRIAYTAHCQAISRVEVRECGVVKHRAFLIDDVAAAGAGAGAPTVSVDRFLTRRQAFPKDYSMHYPASPSEPVPARAPSRGTGDGSRAATASCPCCVSLEGIGLAPGRAADGSEPVALVLGSSVSDGSVLARCVLGFCVPSAVSHLHLSSGQNPARQFAAHQSSAFCRALLPSVAAGPPAQLVLLAHQSRSAVCGGAVPLSGQACPGRLT